MFIQLCANEQTQSNWNVWNMVARLLIKILSNHEKVFDWLAKSLTHKTVRESFKGDDRFVLYNLDKSLYEAKQRILRG